MSEDYSELEGKIVKYSMEGILYSGLVVGCDPDLGITIVNNEDHDDYLCCLLGPSAPNFPGSNVKPGVYFNVIVKAIKAGVVNGDDLNNFIKEQGQTPNYHSFPTADFCAFGQ